MTGDGTLVGALGRRTGAQEDTTRPHAHLVVAGSAAGMGVAAPLLRTGSQGGFRTTDVETQTFVARKSTGNGVQDAAVRRLTPRECERLQGFPDDWTLVRWNGKPAPDSRRYAACGDAVTVPVAEWIGRRIRTRLWAEDFAPLVSA